MKKLSTQIFVLLIAMTTRKHIRTVANQRDASTTHAADGTQPATDTDVKASDDKAQTLRR